MTAAEAETAIGVARGNLKWVGATIRSPMRKWLVAMGVPAATAYRSTYKEWIAAYNDLTDETVKQMAGRPLPETPAIADDDDSEESAPESIQETTGIAPPQGMDESSALAILRRLLGNTCDEKQVRAIVQSELGKTPVHRIEVKIADKIRELDAKPRHKMFRKVLECVLNNIPVLLVGPAGSGKTTLGEQVAEAANARYAMQGAASGTHEYLGYKDAGGAYHSTPWRDTFENGGLFNASELDSGDAAVPLVLNNGLANGHMAFPDSTKPVKRHEDFRIIADANTYGNGADRVYVGRTQLDGATIDRFVVLTVDYDEDLEKQITGNDSWCQRVQAIRKAAREEKARIIISPRASIYGAKLLAAGWTRYEVEEATVWKGCDAELRRRIEARCH